MSDLRLQRIHFVLAAPRCEFLAFGPAGCAEAEILNDERVVVLLAAFFIGPIIGTNLRLFRTQFWIVRTFDLALLCLPTSGRDTGGVSAHAACEAEWKKTRNP